VSNRPTITSSAIATMNAYVGAANSAPAWRTPRTLAASRNAISATPIGTTADRSDGIAEVTAASPEEIETATVSTQSVIRPAAATSPGIRPRFALATMYEPPPWG
jgi:hypothetical protein